MQRRIPVLLILVTIAIVIARLFSPGPATFGSNDRSRWATIRSLVDNGTYIIGYRKMLTSNTYKDRGIITEKGWGTIDKVLRPDTQSFYSSKPPLLPTILAGLYWLIKSLFGLSITASTWIVTRLILVVTNIVSLFLYLALLSLLINRFARTPSAQVFLTACTCFGTFMTTFSVTLNNHTIAAATAAFCVISSN